MNITTPGASSSDGLVWFKSSYSSGEGGACVEAAVSWHKSSYSSSQGDNCVEFAACPSAVHVRDSKDVEGAQLTVAPEAWAAFVGLAAEETVA